MIALTTTLPEEDIQFLEREAKATHRPKNAILSEALKVLRKMKLQEEVRQGFAEHYEEYKAMTESFFDAQAESLNQKNV